MLWWGRCYARHFSEYRDIRRRTYSGLRVQSVSIRRPPKPPHEAIGMDSAWSISWNYTELAEALPQGVEAAYDGMVLDIDPGKENVK